MLAIAGGKGGCGKTTTTVGLGWAFAREELSPLVVDADHEMPDVHVLADISPEPGLSQLERGRHPSEVARPSPVHRRLSVLPAGRADLDEVASALFSLRDWHDPTLVDCPAGAGQDVAVPLRAAEWTLLVTSPRTESLRDTIKTAAMARTLGAEPLGVVTVAPSPQEWDDEMRERDVERLFECPFLGHVPDGGTAPLTAGTVQTAYRELARGVLERNI